MHKSIKLILEGLHKQVMKEDNYDSPDQRFVSENSPNRLDERFIEDLRMMCAKYEAQDLSISDMYHGLIDTAHTIQQFYN